MNTRKLNYTLGLSAVAFAASVLCLSLNNAAYAAPSTDKELDKNQPTAVADLGEVMTEIDTLLASITENLAHASEIQVELVAQSSALSEARMASSEGSEEMLSQIEDAHKAFDEHVAPLLDAATVEAVSLNFTKIEFDYKSRAAIDEDADDDDLNTQVEELSSALSAAQAALDSAKSVSSDLIASYDLKAAKK